MVRKSDLEVKQLEYRLGSELKEFNRLYKEFDELYHGIAVRAELSDSAFCILYAVVEMGDGCLQKEISNVTFQQADNQFVDSKSEIKGLHFAYTGKRT